MLLFDCYTFIDRKQYMQYMQCILNAAQAYEVYRFKGSRVGRVLPDEEGVTGNRGCALAR